ncbi:MAG: DUF47 family protein [Methanobacteriota archaeon]|nr:MAG: DUF47 family protein [Euryarchaeota archaeon]
MNKKEEKEQFFKLADLLQTAGQIIGEIIFQPEPVQEKIDRVLEVEEEGDKIRDRLNEHFAKQQSVPYLALDRAKLLRRIDDVLDEYARTARTVKEYGKFLPTDFAERGAFISETIRSTSESLSQAIKEVYSSFDNAIDLVEKIENSRDEVMEKGMQLEAEYFQKSQDWKQFAALENMHKRAQSIIAKIKNAGEVLSLMAIKYIS